MGNKIIIKKRVNAAIKKKLDSLPIDYTSVRDPNVVDKQAYVNWKRIQMLPIMNEERHLEASDGTQIDLGLLHHQLRAKVAHLPETERVALIELKNKYHRLLCEGNGWKMKAYGNPYNTHRVHDEDVKVRSVLTPKRAEIIELFGRMFSPEEVHKVIVEEWKLPCALPTVHRFRIAYTDQITQRIEEFKKEYSDIRLGVKRGRLEELVYLYTTMKAEYDQNFSVNQHKALLANLEQIRKEVEGDTLKVEGNFSMNLESNINLHLQNEVFKTININQIIIGRCASRMSLPAERLIQMLMDSYYAKMTGMVEDTDDGAYDHMEYPSMIPYDFTRIEQIRKKVDSERLKEAGEYRQLEQADREEATGLSLKERLLTLVNVEIAAVTQRANNVEKGVGKLQLGQTIKKTLKLKPKK